jgi:hypothetical protein
VAAACGDLGGSLGDRMSSHFAYLFEYSWRGGARLDRRRSPFAANERGALSKRLDARSLSLATVVVDCPDAHLLADFYRKLRID